MTEDWPQESADFRLASELSGLADAAQELPAVRRVRLSQVECSYRDWGGDGLRAIVLLHGGALTARSWDLVCAGLHEGYHCIAMDQRGHGSTAAPAGAEGHFDSFVADLAEFVDRLGLADFVLVGQSLGGLVALKYAAAHIDALAGLVVVEAAPSAPWGAGERVAATIKDLPSSFASIEEAVRRLHPLDRTTDPRLLEFRLRQKLRPAPGGGWTWDYDRAHGGRSYGATAGAPPVSDSDVVTVACPTLVVRGSRSRVVDAAAAQRLRERLPRGTLSVVPGGGHNLQDDSPRALVATLRAWLDREVGAPG